jgi:putative hemolysin
MSLAVVLVLAVLVVAWVTAAAAAVRSVSRIWLRHWAEQGARGSEAVDVYLARPQRLLLAAGTMVMLVALLTGLAFGAAASEGIWLDVARIIGAALALLLLGQLLPRAVGRRWGIPLVPLLVPGLRLVDLVLGPVADAVRRFAARRSGGTEPDEEEPRDALEDLLREGALEGVSVGDEAAIISGVVQFGDKRAGDVMTPRAEIVAVDAALPPDELARRVSQSGYSRVPVYEGSLDTPVGMVHVFDLIKATAGRPLRWRALAEASPDTFCNDLLGRMLRGQRHLALVRGADGTIVGLVTLEDLLEELVGDIRDEHDEPELPATPPLAAPPLTAPPLRTPPRP